MSATRAFTGVDATTSMLLQYAGGAHAVLTATLDGRRPEHGSGRRHRCPGGGRRAVLHAHRFTLTRRDGTSSGSTSRDEGRGMWYEAAEVVRCLREGRLESDVMPLDETVAIMATIDEVRRQIGLVYAGD